MIKYLFLSLTLFITDKVLAITSPIPISVGIANINYYPHHLFNDTESDGYIFDLLLEFEANSNYQINYVPLPIKRLKHRFFSQQNIDVLYPYNPNWHKKQGKNIALIYSAPIVGIIGGTMVLKENVGRGLDEFQILGVPRGFTPIEWFKLQQQKKVSIVEVATALDALNMVLRGRVDGADVEYNVAKHLLSKMKQRGKLTMDPSLPYSLVDFHFVTINKKQFIKDLNEFMKQNPDTIRKIKKRFDLKESLSGLATAGH